MQVMTVLLPSVPDQLCKDGYVLQEDPYRRPDNQTSCEASASLVGQILVDGYTSSVKVSSSEDTPPLASIEAEVSKQPSGSTKTDASSVADTATPQVSSSDLTEFSCPALELLMEETDMSVGAGEASEDSSCCLENCDRIMQDLYLGGMEAVLDLQGLAAQGIHAVVCCNRELEFPSSKLFSDLEYYRVDIEDMGREPLELFLPEATAFIHEQLSKERSVLVHCKAGVSRSASVVIGYLMEYHKYSLIDAFLMTLRHRPTITPNPGFIDQLMKYEKELHSTAAASIDLRKYISWMQAPERCSEPDIRPER